MVGSSCEKLCKVQEMEFDLEVKAHICRPQEFGSEKLQALLDNFYTVKLELAEKKRNSGRHLQSREIGFYRNCKSKALGTDLLQYWLKIEENLEDIYKEWGKDWTSGKMASIYIVNKGFCNVALHVILFLRDMKKHTRKIFTNYMEDSKNWKMASTRNC